MKGIFFFILLEKSTMGLKSYLLIQIIFCIFWYIKGCFKVRNKFIMFFFCVFLGFFQAK